jgi:transcriptional regulator with XRE-family HTH domain
MQDDVDLARYAGNKIKELRVQAGLTQDELAKRLSITKTAVSNYENGARMPKQDILFVLSVVFDVSVDTFFPSQKSDKKNTPDLADDDIVLTFEGKQIPPEDLEIMRRFLRGGSNDDK